MRILSQLSCQESPRILAWVAYPFSRWSSQPRNWTKVSWIAGRFFTSWGAREAPEMAGEVTLFVSVACFYVLAWGWLYNSVAFVFSFLFLGARSRFENLFSISISTHLSLSCMVFLVLNFYISLGWVNTLYAMCIYIHIHICILFMLCIKKKCSFIVSKWD